MILAYCYHSLISHTLNAPPLNNINVAEWQELSSSSEACGRL
jgi:hypothetical protein